MVLAVEEIVGTGRQLLLNVGILKSPDFKTNTGVL